MNPQDNPQNTNSSLPKAHHDLCQKISQSHRVVIFGKGEKGAPHCGFTAQVQQVFEMVFPDYQMINILEDESLRADMKVFSDWPTFPQIYIQGEFIGGCDIVIEMYQDGSLQELLIS